VSSKTLRRVSAAWLLGSTTWAGMMPRPVADEASRVITIIEITFLFIFITVEPLGLKG